MLGAIVPPEPEPLPTKRAPAKQKSKATAAGNKGKQAGAPGAAHPQRAAHTLSDSESEGDTAAPPPPRVGMVAYISVIRKNMQFIKIRFLCKFSPAMSSM